MAGSVAVRIRSAEENHSEDGNDLIEGTVYTSDGTAESHRGSAVQRDQCQQEVLSRLAPPAPGRARRAPAREWLTRAGPVQH